MKCRDCGKENETPVGETLEVNDLIEDDVDVDTSAAMYVQLECQDCGAVLGYHGFGAAVGSSDIRGYY